MRLRILTLNVWDLPFGLARDARARMATLGRCLPAHEADVIALQEVWTAQGRRLLAEALRAGGYAHVWHRQRALGGSGLLLASRRAFGEVAFHPFRAAGLPQRVQHADWYGGKGFAIARLTGDEPPVTLVVTHLHAGYGAPGKPDEYVGVRTAQVVQIAHHLAGVDAPVVLAGDLNLRDDGPEYAVLLGATGLVDAGAATGRREPTVLAPHPYRGPDAVPERIDYVMTRSGGGRTVAALSLERVLDAPVDAGARSGPPSDHAGLLAELRIEPTRRGAAPGAPTADPAALAIARRQLAEGRAISRRRVRGEAGLAGAIALGGAALGVTGLSGAPGPPTSAPPARTRRGFLGGLTGALATLGGLAVGGGALAGLAALFAARAERQGYAEAERMLDALAARGRADAPRRDTIPAP